MGIVNPAYIIGKTRGIDIRERGSGNAGASGAFITLGKIAGILCALFDVGKAALAVRLCVLFFPGARFVIPCASVGAVLGHVFPPYMKFRGGKGLACLGGAVLAYNPLVFLIMLGAEVVIVFATDYLCFVPLTASVAFPVVYGVMERDLPGGLILAVIPAVILFRHVGNLKRIKDGTEVRFSFIWRGKRELERAGYHGDPRVRKTKNKPGGRHSK